MQFPPTEKKKRLRGPAWLSTSLAPKKNTTRYVRPRGILRSDAPHFDSRAVTQNGLIMFCLESRAKYCCHLPSTVRDRYFLGAPRHRRGGSAGQSTSFLPPTGEYGRLHAGPATMSRNELTALHTSLATSVQQDAAARARVRPGLEALHLACMVQVQSQPGPWKWVCCCWGS